MNRRQSSSHESRSTRYRLAERALVALALSFVGCSGSDILLSTGHGGDSSGDPPIGENGTAGGTSYFGGGGSAPDFGSVGGSARAGSNDDVGVEVGEAGRTGWVAYDVDLDTEDLPRRHIEIATTDGGCKRALTNSAGQEKQPAFSADGKRIAFVSDRGGIFQIHVMDLANGDSTQLTNENEGVSYPSWSPDGKTIAFVTGDVEDHSDAINTAMLVDVATGKTTRLTEPGRQLYTSSAFASNELLLISTFISLIGIDTHTAAEYDVVHPVASRVPWPVSPSISADRSRFVFSDSCDGQRQLFIARVDGTTGEPCANALHLAPHSDQLIAASWGPAGYVAAETAVHDVVLVASDGAAGFTVLANSAAAERNPAFAPSAVSLNCSK